VIPARLQWTRLLRKVLVDICGWPMVRHVYERAKQAKLPANVLWYVVDLFSLGSPQFFEYFSNRTLVYFNLSRYGNAITDMSSAFGGFTHPN